MVFVPEGKHDSSQARSAWVVWIFGEGTRDDLCPEGGYRTQPRVSTGFNPGNLKINEFALKGREADTINLAPIAAGKLQCAIETC
jgi:hypothetical protein